MGASPQEAADSVWAAIEWLVGSEIALAACIAAWAEILRRIRKDKWSVIHDKLGHLDECLDNSRKENEKSMAKLVTEIREQMESLKTQITGVQFQQARDYATKEDLRNQGRDLKEMIGLREEIRSRGAHRES